MEVDAAALTGHRERQTRHVLQQRPLLAAVAGVELEALRQIVGAEVVVLNLHGADPFTTVVVQRHRDGVIVARAATDDGSVVHVEQRLSVRVVNLLLLSGELPDVRGGMRRGQTHHRIEIGSRLLSSDGDQRDSDHVLTLRQVLHSRLLGVGNGAGGNRHHTVEDVLVRLRGGGRIGKSAGDMVAEHLVTVQVHDDSVLVTQREHGSRNETHVGNVKRLLVELNAVGGRGEASTSALAPATHIVVRPAGRNGSHLVVPLF